MILPDGTELMHGESVYDPVKAREYYLRTRELKGRKKGTGKFPVSKSSTAKPPSGPRARNVVGSGSVSVTLNGKTYKLSPKQLKEQRAYAGVRVKKINEKIRTLERTLKVKLAEAKKKEREAKKPDSAAEKREAAKKSEQYRDKNQQKIKNAAKKDAATKKDSKPDLNTVQGLETAITDARVKLADAVDRQRALATAR